MSSNHNRQRLRVVGLAIVVASAFLIVGCAIPKSPVSYVPQQNVQAIRGADTVAVEVKVEDLQADPSVSVWDWLNPVDRKQYIGVKNAADTIKEAAETELRARGFRIGSGDALVTIQLGPFGALVEEGFWTVSEHGLLATLVQVERPKGKVLYSKVVAGEGDPDRGYVYVRSPKKELEETLADTLKRLFADPRFTAAILATRKP